MRRGGDARLRRARRRRWDPEGEGQSPEESGSTLSGGEEAETPEERVEAGAAVWIVVPCKGRLSFLRQTAKLWQKYTDFHVCLVDYSCPERCGDWLETEFPDCPEGRRWLVERVPGRALFNKSAAHNAGAACALRHGAEYICFLDADTALREGFGAFVRQHLDRSKFLIAGLHQGVLDIPSMTGLLVVPAASFSQVGGFDESFIGWGGEDIEMRFRLHLVGGLSFSDVPSSLTQPLEHGDELRTQYYEQSDLVCSNSQNIQRVREKIEMEWNWAPHVTEESASRLWYRGSVFDAVEPLRRRSALEGARAQKGATLGRRHPRQEMARRLLRSASEQSF